YLSDQIPQGTLAPGQELPDYTGAKVTETIYSDFCKSLKEYSTRKPSQPPETPEKTTELHQQNSTSRALSMPILVGPQMNRSDVNLRHGTVSSNYSNDSNQYIRFPSSPTPDSTNSLQKSNYVTEQTHFTSGLSPPSPHRSQMELNYRTDHAVMPGHRNTDSNGFQPGNPGYIIADPNTYLKLTSPVQTQPMYQNFTHSPNAIPHSFNNSISLPQDNFSLPAVYDPTLPFPETNVTLLGGFHQDPITSAQLYQSNYGATNKTKRPPTDF
ncbi:hypothetical protein HK096_009628, partial [Nowakowskiella sp. JEL0078]